MSWRDEFLQGPALAPAEAPTVERPPFTPSLPHFITNGDGTWSLTPYAWAHCIHCGAELGDGESGSCADCRTKYDVTVMPWER